ncbi:hypothetical protein G6F67_009177 [Rhizopus microsporus]|nr:hypothetical protein G6F67_009177 [Rhizopus microsporus]
MKRVPGVSRSTLSKYKNLYAPKRTRGHAGRKTTISSTTKNYLKRELINGSLQTAKSVWSYLNSIGYKIGYFGTVKMLHSMGFSTQIKKKKPLLKKSHMEARLKWAKAHKDWTEDDWRRMVFSDETKINVWGSDGCKYFWRRPGDKLQLHHLDLTVKGGAGSVMLWGCMTWDGPGYACAIEDGTMKASDYVHILSTTLMDSLNYYGYKQEAIYFQQDNDPKHTLKLARAWFKENGFKEEHTFNWPAQSPDLNPIEHLWHHLKLRLSLYEGRAKGVHDLWSRIEKEWNSFTKEQCQAYIKSMPARCRAVIKAKGGYTRY